MKVTPCSSRVIRQSVSSCPSAGRSSCSACHPQANEKVIDIVGLQVNFGEALMFLERPHYPVGAQALQATEVPSFDALDFADMLKGSVETCFVMLGSA